ncbi:hypothetical protein BASA50_011200 [Batrachochytrium salamandrivorans]|uniref:BLOC-1-related complex subunit 6 C-terminal helix domain-containing protein n=1 Tax=Batrachochytrium salamandrivorans TaxID=1357716 RepID=A0ABQ8EZ46_9FUNG|nr:hypothetical protein BASA60_008987 [Batrachochytrium salamandrivorans]KAH6587595.1 hypothetical protein BASA50_011200 [Batrachochytrium salamandrivorans]KAH6603006.1 hypothetical protein BASA61_000536 [Batrachochytrium salamandrivorans]KAH9255860.1 hypothetical protein BASA81_006034 [Batrachochytrium salamandrivorans]KAH9274472.1 hypothetical protein BASA83_003105 [Batrachochytrium salamandrivorans]
MSLSTVGLSTPLLRDSVFSVPLDPALLEDIELQAEVIGTDLAQLLQNLQGRLKEISGYTLQSVELHKAAINNLCDAVDENMNKTSQFVQVVDDISQDMIAVQRLSRQISDIRMSLDWLEGVVSASIPATPGTSGNILTDAFASVRIAARGNSRSSRTSKE